jgi:hypothetical protein
MNRRHWGSSNKDIYVAMPNMPGGLVHFDGTSWTEVHVSTTSNLVGFTGIWGSGPNDVWASASYAVGGEDGFFFDEIYHWNGSQWSEPYDPGSATVGRIWGTDSSHVWIVGATEATGSKARHPFGKGRAQAGTPAPSRPRTPADGRLGLERDRHLGSWLLGDDLAPPAVSDMPYRKFTLLRPLRTDLVAHIKDR